MDELWLIGIGTGNPDHLTRQGIMAIKSADTILIPRKGANKTDLADLRRDICAQILDDDLGRIVEFDLPRRNTDADYLADVQSWHDEIAKTWTEALPDDAGKVAFLVWGDPSLYDSTMRIAGRLDPSPKVFVVPGITSLQALTAAHRIPLNDVGAPILITTGRRLRDKGWPDDADTIAVMLDGECSFQTLQATDFDIWWGAYLGMRNEVLVSGRLSDVAADILELRASARESHGWIMDIYLLRRRA